MTNKDDKNIHKTIQMRFTGSCRAMTSSLDKGVSTLEDDQYKDLREFYMRDEVFNPL